MFREIKKKQIILENRKPYRPHVTEYINKMNLMDWVYSSIRLDGSLLSRENVEKMLGGDFIVEAALSDHALVESYYNAIQYAYDILSLNSDINEKIIFQFHSMLSGGAEAQYRRGNPVLVSLGYNPPHSRDVEGQMRLMLSWLYSEDMDTNVLMKAACLHNRFIEIYPFEENSEAMARFVMEYYLIRKGYPPIGLNLSEQEYNNGVIKYLKGDDMQPFYNALERTMYNKMEVLMQLTAME